jgi:hypothetical protein
MSHKRENIIDFSGVPMPAALKSVYDLFAKFKGKVLKEDVQIMNSNIDRDKRNVKIFKTGILFEQSKKH